MIYYNDNDSFMAKWLQCLINEGLIPKGDVDDRSITEIKPADLRGYKQCHFFAGLAGWPYALALAGWPRDRAVWTGSCPCQPFSKAGKGKGVDDERHLWPAFRWLIAQRRPAAVFGEQVASKDGRQWFSGVRVDLEAMGYDVGGADLCAASVGAPNIRQRLWWVADAMPTGRTSRWAEPGEGQATMRSAYRGGMGNTQSDNEQRMREREPVSGSNGQGGRSGPWDNFGIVECADGKQRRIPKSSIQHVDYGLSDSLDTDWVHGDFENKAEVQRLCESYSAIFREMISTFPLCRKVPGRAGILRGAGNSINPWVAAEFVRSFMQINP